MNRYLLYCIVLFSTVVYAGEPDMSEKKRESETQQYRNMIVQMNGLDFDYRILKYYSPDELQALSPEKRRQLHFLYSASYEVLNADACPAFSQLDIDVAALERFRQEDTPAEVETGDACKVKVRLISRTACRNTMDELVK